MFRFYLFFGTIFSLLASLFLALAIGCGVSSTGTISTTTSLSTTTTLSTPLLGAYISTDEGQTFSSATAVSIPNFSAIGLVDPSAVPLGDGRIRLYYFASFTAEGDPVTNQPEGINRFYSAVSDDGITFSEEAQVISNEDISLLTISDPFILKNQSGTYVMYASVGTNILRATSTDGFSFSWDTGFNFTQGGVPGALLLSSGKIRLYYHSNNGIKSAVSSSESGQSFTTEEGFRIDVPGGDYTMAGDPNPIKFSSNKWVMCYKKGSGDFTSDVVFVAQSTDEGVTWVDLSSEAITTGSTPTMVKDANGRLILYTNYSVSTP